MEDNKDSIFELCPNLTHIKDNQLDITCFRDMLEHTWKSLDQNKIQGLTLLIPYGLEAVRKASIKEGEEGFIFMY